MIDAVSDEERGKDVDGIMEMAEEHAQAEDDSGNKKDISQFFMLPKYESHKEGQAGMGRKKHIIAPGHIKKKLFRIEKRMVWRRGEMGHHDKNRTDQHENSNALHHERHFFRIASNERHYENPKHKSAFEKDEVYIEHWNIVQNNVRNIIISPEVSINIGVIINKQTEEKQQDAKKSA